MKRTKQDNTIRQHFRMHPIVAILGPRQSGKTTLARQYCESVPDFVDSNYFDLEDPIDLARLNHPMLALESLQGLVVIDEIQRRPDLVPILRVLADKTNIQFLILGSASRELIKQSSESLAGRIAYMELTPFSYQEVEHLQDIWIRGGFPKSFLAPTLADSVDWREFYITTFLEQDIPNLGIQIPPATLRRFWAMLAHYHGNIFNASELGRSFGSSDTTIRRYLDILTGTFMIRQLQPWHANVSKRQVKAPKIYFRDSGLFHTILDISDLSQLQKHPKLGSSWEGFALEEVIRARGIKSHQCFFWATHAGAELDLLIVDKNCREGFEFKYTDAPILTPSMKISVSDLELQQLTVIYPGKKSYALGENISVINLEDYLAQM